MEWIQYTERIAIAAMVLLAGLVALRLLPKAINKVAGRLPFLPTGILLPIGKTAILTLSLILVLSAILGTSPVILISGLGVSLGMVALALKDVISSFLTGVKILAEGNIKIGQVVELKKCGVRGIVIDITISKVALDCGTKITIVPVGEVAKDIVSIVRERK